MIVLLVLVSVLALSVETSIDWSTCGTETKCFCGNTRTNVLLEQMRITSEAERKENCKEFGLQSRFFSEDVALFQIQVNRQLKKVYLEHGDFKFGCDFTNNQPKLLAAGDPEQLPLFKIKRLYDKLSHSKGEETVCAVKVELASQLYQVLLRTEATALRINDDPIERCPKSAKAGNDFFSSQENPFVFKPMPSTLTDYKLQPLTSNDMNIKFTCENSLYTMRYTNATTIEPEYIEALECKKHTDNIYYFFTKKKNISEEFRIEYPETFSFFCARHFAESCSKPACTDDSHNICPEYKAGSSGKPATLSCTGNKWVIPNNDKNEFVTLKNNPVCKKDVTDNNEAAFFFTLDSGRVDKKDKARCFTDYDCKLHSGLVLPCANETSCIVVDQSNDEIKCKNESEFIHLTVYPRYTDDRKDENWIDFKSYTCNKNTGEYTNGERSIPRKSVVRCIAERPPPPAAPIINDKTGYAIVGGVTGGVIFLIFVRRRKYKLKLKGRDAWRKMKNRDERIKTCKETFAAVCIATTHTAENVLAGFDFIETMLDAGTEDPECWAEAYVFLKMFHGAITKIDHQIWHMFLRYMYLQGKQIIDKHGWISPKLIRKDSRKGLIRTVAINLLGFAVFNPKESEAEDLIVEGFQQLQYNSWTQYPHCGLLWSVLTHTRPLATKTGSNVAKFDRLKFVKYLHERMRVKQGLIPHDMVIPEFGTISFQTAYALGASPGLCFHDTKGVQLVTPDKDNITGKKWGFTDSGQIPIGYIVGLNESISRDPTGNILTATCSLYSLDKDYEKLLREWGTSDDWNPRFERGLRTAVYYGRGMDAKKLYNRFIADVKVAEVMPKGAEGVDAAQEKKEKERDAKKKVKAAQEKKEKERDAKKMEQKTPPMDDEPAAKPADPPAGGAGPEDAKLADPPKSAPSDPPAPDPPAAAAPAAPMAEDKTLPMMDGDDVTGAKKAPQAPRAASGADAAAPAAAPAAPAAAAVAAPAADAAKAPAAPAPPDNADPFAPKKEDPSHQLELTQQEFSDAIEFILESLRKWFAKRTDKEELKTKPVYPVDDKFNLDNRISKDKKTDVEGDKRTPGACESSNADDPVKPPVAAKSKSQSNSSDTRKSPVQAASSKSKKAKPAPPPPPAAAAAAPVKP